jgi:UDP-N-acetylmuramate--alanine ligase
MKYFEPDSRIHMIGIAGSGMSGIAEILLKRGFHVSGSDERESETTKNLQDRGATIYIGHGADHVLGATSVVISSAIAESNPELIAARASGIEVIRRASALSRLLPGKYSIAVAGTHGKTTTSGMFAQLLFDLGRSPSFVIGSKIASLQASAMEGSGPEFVVEADESDGSFLEYRPDVAIVTNIELDHVDNFHSLTEVLNLFSQFVATARELVVVCEDDANAASLPVPTGVRRISYGVSESADLRITHLTSVGSGTLSQISFHGESLGELRLTIPGTHNVLNAVAVIATSIGMGLAAKDVITSLAAFGGTARRFEIKGSVAGITVVDDYGHHPTEIEATINSARSFLAAQGAGRLAVVFQPHRFSRTAVFVEQFADALARADHCILMDIYSAGEEPLEGVSSALIGMKTPGAKHFSDRMKVVDEVVGWAKPGDLILTLGAGDVTQMGGLILEALEEK